MGRNLNYLTFGLRSVWFHATNVALHAAATMLFTRVCLTIAGLRKNFAILAGVLFAVHPIHTEATNRKVYNPDPEVQKRTKLPVRLIFVYNSPHHCHGVLAKKTTSLICRLYWSS
uniref:Uncharacterized protein n=1 Tax=Anopheles epiroticus TaxID=199890 RepID=A0A182P1V1_9DIPT